MSVSAYPEKHPDSRHANVDLDMLQAKVDAGATRAITQFFFENDLYFRYVDRVRSRGIDIPIVPGIVPVQNFKQVKNFAERCGTFIPNWLAERFEGLDDDVATRKLVAARSRRRTGVRSGRSRRHRFPFLHDEPRRPRLRDLPHAGRASGGEGGGVSFASVFKPCSETHEVIQNESILRSLAAERILLLDGGMGTMLQERRFDEAAFRNSRFKDWQQDVRGNNDLLILTQPDAVREIHLAYFQAGADIVSTNTFSSTVIAQADYGMESLVPELNRVGAQLVRDAAISAQKRDGRQRFVAGAIGPTNRTASISPDVNNPGFRAVSFDELKAAYAEQAAALLEGGVDILLVETIFDTLNAKAALYAIAELEEARGEKIPVMISGTITDLSGRMLAGQTPEAFWNSIRHAAPLSVGLNCALGAKEMRAHIAEICRASPTR